MKTDFSQPRFVGARFEEHTLPVEVARDLAAYESLVVELAKRLYMQAHPDRQRVPKGFASNFRLDIDRIDPGSTKPVLALVLSGVLALTGGEQDYFVQARDLVADCIAAPSDALPTSFPRELLVHFNQFGRSLHEGEALELPRRSGIDTARLTPETRKRLVLAADQVYERDISLVGSIEEVDFAKSSFRLKLVDGGQINVPMPDSFENNAREYAGRPRHQVNVIGSGAYDSWERLQKVISVDGIDVLKNFAISSRFDEISQIKDGWFEGSGVSADPDKLMVVGEKLVADYPDRLPLPSIVPTQDGNLVMEWKAKGDPSLDVNLRTLQANFHAFDDTGSDLERDFNLDDGGWRALFVFLHDNVKVDQT